VVVAFGVGFIVAVITMWRDKLERETDTIIIQAMQESIREKDEIIESYRQRLAGRYQ